MAAPKLIWNSFEMDAVSGNKAIGPKTNCATESMAIHLMYWIDG